MEQKYTDDTFLARWLNKDLNKEELIAFEKTKEYKEHGNHCMDIFTGCSNDVCINVINQ